MAEYRIKEENKKALLNKQLSRTLPILIISIFVGIW